MAFVLIKVVPTGRRRTERLRGHLSWHGWQYDVRRVNTKVFTRWFIGGTRSRWTVTRFTSIWMHDSLPLFSQFGSARDRRIIAPQPPTRGRAATISPSIFKQYIFANVYFDPQG